MPLGWWLQASVTPVVILAILAGLGWAVYSLSAPSDQRPTIVSGMVAGFRLEDVSGARGGSRLWIVVAMRDGRQVSIAVPKGVADRCHVGGVISLDHYVGRLGQDILRAGAHPCG